VGHGVSGTFSEGGKGKQEGHQNKGKGKVRKSECYLKAKKERGEKERVIREGEVGWGDGLNHIGRKGGMGTEMGYQGGKHSGVPGEDLGTCSRGQRNSTILRGHGA